jgi:Histidine kinase-like ATPase domain
VVTFIAFRLAIRVDSIADPPYDPEIASDPGQIALVRRLPSDPDAPGAARELAQDLLGRLGCGGERSDDLALAVSELVTNAVVHAKSGLVEVKLVGTARRIRVEVKDHGTEYFEWPTQPGEGHWGLGLVSIFCERAGVIRRPSTVVWCELDLAAAASG